MFDERGPAPVTPKIARNLEAAPDPLPFAQVFASNIGGVEPPSG